VDEFKDPTHFPCDIFVGAWDHYMTYDMKTLQVYETQSSDYLENVTKEHPSKTLKYFETNLPGESYVLDYGCGPGLCAEYLANLGHNVTAFDASQNMVQLVPKHKRIRSYQATFDTFSDNRIFDGIWASFSLLHAERKDFPRLLACIKRAIKPNGLFSIGLKLGAGEKRDELGRRYTYVSQNELDQLLKDSGFNVFNHILGEDIGLDGVLSKWVFAYARA
jgi:SAM-dependent methyltransferase